MSSEAQVRHSSFRSHAAAGVALSLCLFVRTARADSADLCADAYERAQSVQAKGSLLAARAAAEQCSQSCPVPLSEDCRNWQKELQNSVPSVVITVVDDHGASSHGAITLDSVAVATGKELELDPGQHVARAEFKGQRAESIFEAKRGVRGRQIQLVLVSQAPKSVVTDRAPLPTARPKPTWPAYTLAGVGLVAFATSGTLTLVGHIKRHNLEQSCSPYCSQSSVNEVRQLWWWGSGFAVLGAVSLGGAWLSWPVTSSSKVAAGPGLVEWSTQF